MKRNQAVVVLSLLPLVVFLVAGLAWLRPRPTLVVWSCGGNYESLREYTALFEEREGVRVRYTSAPAAFLLAKALSCSSPPDVMVGRGGPGWDSLQDVGRCAGPPTIFAADPLVIAVAPGNPKGIRSVADLGRKGIRVSLSPGAMRPKSKVPAMFMAAVSAKLYPGLVERWQNNAVTHETCGRRLLDSIVDGRADAAIAPRSLLFYAEYRGKVEEVEIPAKELLTMKICPAIPQCAVALSGDTQERRDLAERFVEGLPKAEQWLRDHGYVPAGDQRAKAIGRLLKALAPKNMPGWQVLLAEKLNEAGLAAETRRRYLKVLHTFGPNRYTARALWNVAEQSLNEGDSWLAKHDATRVLDEYPPGEPVEYDLPMSPQKLERQPIEKMPHQHWQDEARLLLEQVASQDVELPPVLGDPLVRELFPIRVTQGDPPKNGTRDLALGLHLMVAGDYEFAARDLLKVVTLHRPSRHMAAAEYLLGVCAEKRGLPAIARQQWERVVNDYPESKACVLAKAALARLGTDAALQSGNLPMPAWNEGYVTHGDRGMTYGMRLYEHRLPLFSYKEMVKLLSGIYGKHKLGGRARFCAGMACEAMGNQSAAVYQWRRCLRDAKDTEWATKASEGLVRLGRKPTALPGKPPTKRPTGSAGKRFVLAEEFFQAGVHEQKQICMEYLKVLTVARPPAKALTPESKKMLAKAAQHLEFCLVKAGKSQEEAREVIRSIPGSNAFLPGAKEAQP